MEHGGTLFQPGMAGHRFHFRLRARGNLFSRPCAVRTGQQITRYHRGDFQLCIVLLAADHEPWKYLQQLYQQYRLPGAYLRDNGRAGNGKRCGERRKNAGDPR